jgi:hypothetical protein
MLYNWNDRAYSMWTVDLTPYTYTVWLGILQYSLIPQLKHVCMPQTICVTILDMVRVFVISKSTVLSHFQGFMMNNNGFWIGWLDLLTRSFTVPHNYNKLQQLTINDCLRFTPFFPGLPVSSLLLWLTWFWFTNWSLLQMWRMMNEESHMIPHLRISCLPTQVRMKNEDLNDGCILTDCSSDSVTADQSHTCPPFITSRWTECRSLLPTVHVIARVLIP